MSAPRITASEIERIMERNECIGGPFPHDIPWLVAEIEALNEELRLAKFCADSYQIAARIWRELYEYERVSSERLLSGAE